MLTNLHNQVQNSEKLSTRIQTFLPQKKKIKILLFIFATICMNIIPSYLGFLFTQRHLTPFFLKNTFFPS